MKNWKLELFNFKKRLSYDQTDVSFIVEKHMNNLDNFSEMEIKKSLTENLLKYTYDREVKGFLEGLQQEIESQPLAYKLKDLYKRIERNNQGMLYRQPMKIILDAINLTSDDDRIELILNELKIYDYIPEIKNFVLDLTKSPIERQNLRNSGKGSKIYTIVEKTDDGYLAYIGNKWFLIGENNITQVLIDDYIKTDEKIKDIRLLESALNLSQIDENQIRFRIDENLVLGISTKNDKYLYINDEKLDDDAVLENIFNSPIVPYLKKDYYMIINSIKENMSNLVELDIVLKLENMLNPYLELYAFNYKDKMYLYHKDNRIGNSFYEYESVNELVRDVQKDVDYDLTSFYENKLSKELKKLKGLEDKEMMIDMKIKETNEAIDILKNEQELMENDEKSVLLFNNMLLYRDKLYRQKNTINERKNNYRKTILK
jgi:hypothetical protein